MKLKDNWIVKNLVLALLYFAFLVLGVSLGLHLVTRHGKTVTAPDFTNLSVSEARQLAQASHVNVKVVDSVYVRRLSGGVVYRQLPKAGATVKKGRSIFLTINSIVPRKVVMPNLYGYSVTEARSELKNRGLNLGKLNYVKDIATNTVLAQEVDGVEVQAGDLVVSGSTVDLTVAMADENNRTVVPRLIGLKYIEALEALGDRFLNAGNVRFDPEIRSYTDSVNAVVYKQDVSAGNNRPLGARIGFSLTLDSAKLPAR